MIPSEWPSPHYGLISLQIQTFTQGGEVVDFQELSEGAFLNDVFFQMLVDKSVCLFLSMYPHSVCHLLKCHECVQSSLINPLTFLPVGKSGIMVIWDSLVVCSVIDNKVWWGIWCMALKWESWDIQLTRSVCTIPGLRMLLVQGSILVLLVCNISLVYCYHEYIKLIFWVLSDEVGSNIKILASSIVPAWYLLLIFKQVILHDAVYFHKILAPFF